MPFSFLSYFHPSIYLLCLVCISRRNLLSCCCFSALIFFFSFLEWDERRLLTLRRSRGIFFCQRTNIAFIVGLSSPLFLHVTVLSPLLKICYGLKAFHCQYSKISLSIFFMPPQFLSSFLPQQLDVCSNIFFFECAQTHFKQWWWSKYINFFFFLLQHSWMIMRS